MSKVWNWYESQFVTELQIYTVLNILMQILVVSAAFAALIYIFLKLLDVVLEKLGDHIKINLSWPVLFLLVLVGFSVGYISGASRESAAEAIISGLLGILGTSSLYYYYYFTQSRIGEVVKEFSASGHKRRKKKNRNRNCCCIQNTESRLDQENKMNFRNAMKKVGSVAPLFLFVVILSIHIGLNSGAERRDKYEREQQNVENGVRICVAYYSSANKNIDRLEEYCKDVLQKFKVKAKASGNVVIEYNGQK